LLLVLAVNSAIGAVYYLRLVYLSLIASADTSSPFASSPFRSRALAGCIAAAALVVLAFVPMTDPAASAAAYAPVRPELNVNVPAPTVAAQAPAVAGTPAH
ncbi:MAG TPA: hypothetical protein VFF65_01395, partial [Phycisphaerales bacterium]|nr:hypothetical protein [Phycisphaerales bacterium]